MKKIFEVLQKGLMVAILGIFFAAVPKWTKDFGIAATWICLLLAIVVLILVGWNIFAKWTVPKQGYLLANGGSAAMGLASSLLILWYSVRPMTDESLLMYLKISLAMGAAAIIWGLFLQWFVKPWKDDKGRA